MIIDNKSSIQSILEFSGSNYYIIQILQRKKDNPEIKGDSVKIETLFISSLKEFNNKWDKIVNTCKTYKARAYINLLPLSQELLAKNLMLELSDRILKGNYNRVNGLIYSLSTTNKLIDRDVLKKPIWVIDVDYTDKEKIKVIENLMKEKTTIVESLETLGGVHLIVDSFNINSLKEYSTAGDYNYKYEEVDFCIKMTPSTILYYEG